MCSIFYQFSPFWPLIKKAVSGILGISLGCGILFEDSHEIKINSIRPDISFI